MHSGVPEAFRVELQKKKQERAHIWAALGLQVDVNHDLHGGGGPARPLLAGSAEKKIIII